MNKTIPLWIGGIFLAENVFGIAPKNTHHWEKLASPLDVQRILSACKFFLQLKTHIYFNCQFFAPVDFSGLSNCIDKWLHIRCLS